MESQHLPFGQSHADKCRVGELKWRGMPPGIPPEMADQFMAKLRAGSTIRKLTGGGKRLGPAFVSYERFKKHCSLHPEWAKEAWRISKINGNFGKGSPLRLTTHCRAGLHLMAGDNVYLDGTHGRRRCVACRRASTAFAPPMSAEVAERVKKALAGGASLSQIATGQPTGGGPKNRSLFITSHKIIKRHRLENPEFGAFVASAIADSLIVGQRLRHQRRRSARKRDENNDYYRIRDMIPESNPHRDDIVARIFEDLLSGALQREQLQPRVKAYITEMNRLYPTQYRKFGDSPLVSLDEVMFEDGATTRGDRVSSAFGTNEAPEPRAAAVWSDSRSSVGEYRSSGHAATELGQIEDTNIRGSYFLGLKACTCARSWSK